MAASLTAPLSRCDQRASRAPGWRCNRTTSGSSLRGETFQRREDGCVVVEAVHALGAPAQLGGGLRPAQQQQAEHSDLVTAQVQHVAHAVLKLGDARIRDGADEAHLAELEERGAHIGLDELHDGLAARLLVAGVQCGVEGERIVLRRVDLFFNQAAEHAGFDGVQLDHAPILSTANRHRAARTIRNDTYRPIPICLLFL